MNQTHIAVDFISAEYDLEEQEGFAKRKPKGYVPRRPVSKLEQMIQDGDLTIEGSAQKEGDDGHSHTGGRNGGE